SATDNSGSATVVSEPASGSTFPKGTTTVVSTATDPLGNSSTCSFTVTVSDSIPPVLGTLSNITVNNDAGKCGAAVSFSLSATDDCSGATVSSEPASGSYFACGTTTVNVTATDGAGNTTHG